MTQEQDRTGVPLITVCIPTFRRTHRLPGLLQALVDLPIPAGARYEILVVDNDEARSAEPIVTGYAGSGRVPVRYLSEPVRGIARVRNRLIDGARGTLLAFIDDDEYPSKEWLISLHRVWCAGSADVIFGPVFPAYPDHAPAWLRKSGVCERRGYEDGEALSPGQVGGGNFLCSKDLFRRTGVRFSEAFDSGGEDSDVFYRLYKIGVRFAGCRDAVVFEEVPESRMRVSWWLQRAFRCGYRHARIYGKRDDGRVSFGYFAGAGAKVVLLSAVILPWATMGRAGFVRAGIWWMANAGKLAALYGRVK